MTDALSLGNATHLDQLMSYNFYLFVYPFKSVVGRRLVANRKVKKCSRNMSRGGIHVFKEIRRIILCINKKRKIIKYQ